MNALRPIKGIYFWCMATVVTACLYSCCAWEHLLTRLLRRPRDGRPEHQVASLWGRSMIRFMPGWRVTVDGSEYLPQDGQPMVVVANHESMSDIWAMYYLGIQFRWLSKESVFKVPMVGQAMQWAHYVPIKRGSRESASMAMEESAARVRQGLSMFFFPEGTRSRDGVMKPFKSGAFKLAQNEQVPILPVAIHGAGDLLPKGSWMPGEARVRIKVLPPLPPPPPGDGNIDAFAASVRAQILAAHTELV